MKYKWEVDCIIVYLLQKRLNEIEKDGGEVFNVLSIGGGGEVVIVSRRPSDADVSDRLVWRERENRSLSPY